jgi:septal ring factor EnvC (AmiA/AmiB activator)
LKGRYLKVNHIIYKMIRKHKDHDRLDFNEEEIGKVYEEEAEEYEKRRKLIWDYEAIEEKEKELRDIEDQQRREQEEYEMQRMERKKKKIEPNPEEIERKKLSRIEEIKNKHKRILREQDSQSSRRI